MTGGTGLFSFHGSIGRLVWWETQVGLVCAYFVAIFFALILGEPGNFISIFFIIPLAWIGLAANAKRFHDRNKSGWWQLIVLIPFIGYIWLIIELGFLAGMPVSRDSRRAGQS